MPATHRDPTFDHAVREEMRIKKCGCCVRSRAVMPGVYVCEVNKQFPRCKREKKGFEYDEGGL